jgi:hypothetical protein
MICLLKCMYHTRKVSGYVYVLGVSILHLFTILILDNGTVLTVSYFCLFFILFVIAYVSSNFVTPIPDFISDTNYILQEVILDNFHICSAQKIEWKHFTKRNFLFFFQK